MPRPLLGIGFLGTLDSEWRNQDDPAKNQPFASSAYGKSRLIGSMNAAFNEQQAEWMASKSSNL